MLGTAADASTSASPRSRALRGADAAEKVAEHRHLRVPAGDSRRSACQAGEAPRLTNSCRSAATLKTASASSLRSQPSLRSST